MYFLSNDVKGNDCSCTTSFNMPSLSETKTTQASYTKMPASHCGVVVPTVETSPIPKTKMPAGTCSIAASYKIPAAACETILPARQPAAVRRQRPYTRARHEGFQRPAMVMEPVAKVSAQYEETESNRPFDYEVDYGNAFAGYSDIPLSQTEDSDIYFIPKTYDRTSPKYLEALRDFYDKLGYPNFTPDNGYNSRIEQELFTQSQYGKIQKF